MAPEILDGIEFGRVGREPFDTQPVSAVGEKLGGVGAAVGWQPVPQKQNASRNVAPEAAQECRHALAVDRVGVNGQQKPNPLPLRVDGQRADQGQPFPIERLGQLGCLPLRRPGPPDAGTLRPAAAGRLVEEDNGGPLDLGFFLMRGQSC